MIHVRRAGPLDAGAMADLLNEVIAAGGTTAMTEPVTGKDLRDRMGRSELSVWHLAENDSGTVLGFQWIEPLTGESGRVAEIATFARVGQTGLGIGSALFDATRQAAAAAGYDWIRANIRADNAGGLAYYQSRGFEDYGRIEGYRMGNGQVVDKILKRYEL
ncbi:acetyltransferase, GNAT family protein [Pseudooceanicola batsensis HTCC2597]|uniref:Acetyltransferase, GNAT family protein n=1 Tax=Pseudooceanicola batsensis (strain ATCC BAA-863 / DSM 15984 / KCTC 12145 / HTCC2597) TaxID=252305 RepID=A3TXW6_PSEBH|nr:GNAT family N-acetyltransferase [Pseudooceanicola batsensis]EAQ03000.1 acetyltransferase, GNAT family protein [Pseudooceanicola batsensis HTCC2597]